FKRGHVAGRFHVNGAGIEKSRTAEIADQPQRSAVIREYVSLIGNSLARYAVFEQGLHAGAKVRICFDDSICLIVEIHARNGAGSGDDVIDVIPLHQLAWLADLALNPIAADVRGMRGHLDGTAAFELDDLV